MRYLIGLLLVLGVALATPRATVAQQQPGGGGSRGGRGGGGFGDPNAFFNQLSNGKDVIVRSEITDPRMQGMFDRWAERLQITNGQITRDQFTAMMRDRQNQRGGGGPNGAGGAQAPGAPAGDNSGQDRTTQWADGMFRRLDVNGDGVLNNDEMPEALRAERDKWDTDKNGLIDLNEFRAYFQARVQQFMVDRGQGNGGFPQDSGAIPGMEAPAAAPPPEEQKPVVHRFGKLPKGLPAWFQQLDTDQDGQVGLYEWRAAGRSIDEFVKMDRNNDGFLTVEEVLRYTALNPTKTGGTALAQENGRGTNAGTAPANGPVTRESNFRGRNGGGRRGGQQSDQRSSGP